MIKVSNLTKSYDKVIAVNDLSFEIKEGTIWGFVGPNGSGKTTTLRMLATLLTPDSGTAEVAGYDIKQNPKQIRANIGYMPDFFGVYDSLKVWEYLAFYADAFQIDSMLANKRSEELLELVELTHKKYDYVDVLSRGMKQRLGLARALIHDPKVLLLDEPASGLDPRARVELRGILKKLRTLGKTVIISSHILPELAEMCSEIGIMEEGKLLAVGSVGEIMQKMKLAGQINIKVLDKDDIPLAVSTLQSKGITNPSIEELTISFSSNDTPTQIADILRKLVLAKVNVVEFKESSHNLEDVFLKITKEVE